MAQSKIALVTGGSRGLGKDMAINIAKKGIDIILTYNSKKDDADNTATEIKQLGRKAEVLKLNAEDIKSFDGFIQSVNSLLNDVFKADKINFIVNNAGIGIHELFADTTEAQFDELMNLQLKGPFFLTQKVLPLMADGGAIINVSSGLARFTYPGYSAYATMKGAMEVLTRYQAKELGARGIRSNIVAPGATATDFGGGAVRDNEQLNKQVASLVALGRVGQADDIGSVVAFLCTDDAKWINAQRIEISGGQSL